MYLHLLFLVALVQFGESQNGDGRSTTLNSCHCLIPADQCATKDEVESVQADIQSLTSIVVDIQTNMQQLLQTLNPDSTEETPTTEPLYTCNGTPGWKRVVNIDMTDTSYNCPPGLQLTNYSKRTCGRTPSKYNYKCSSTTFSLNGSEYSQVCGRITGYQVGATLAFLGYAYDNRTIDDQYVDGVSLTHGPGGGRQHIWTFAAGLNKLRAYNRCPCDGSPRVVPPFVGDDYFCESGLSRNWNNDLYGELFPDDPLWDGHGCSSTSTCCQFNNPPWFTKNLINSTTDDIELRLCFHNPSANTDVGLELVELYTQ